MSTDSIHWDNLSNNLPELTDESLKNFRSENFSRRISFGLDDIGNISQFNFQIGELINYFDISDIKESIGSKKGNPKIYINSDFGIKTSFNDLFLIGYFLKLKPLVNENDLIIEIGAGYGGLAEKFLKLSNFKKYYIFDISTSIILQEYFLKEYKSLDNNRLEILQFNQFDKKLRSICEKRDNGKLIIINTRSFMEMTKNTIKNYFDTFQKHTKKGDILFNANRYKKSMSGEVIKIKNYPYDNKWILLSASYSIGQPYIFELLTSRRKDEDSTYSFINFLNSINIPRNHLFKDNKFLEMKIIIKYKIKKLIKILTKNFNYN